MAYTMINNMSSARYPLKGLGCGCTGIGQTPDTSTPSPGSSIGYMLPLLGIAGLILFVGMGAGAKAVSKNRRSRR